MPATQVTAPFIDAFILGVFDLAAYGGGVDEGVNVGVALDFDEGG